jgi:hypothetical protein
MTSRKYWRTIAETNYEGCPTSISPYRRPWSRHLLKADLLQLHENLAGRPPHSPINSHPEWRELQSRASEQLLYRNFLDVLEINPGAGDG